MNNILCCNAGRRGRLMIDMRKTLSVIVVMWLLQITGR